ncbi:unnamed protein product, partial [Prorocentrum cordatum]
KRVGRWSIPPPASWATAPPPAATSAGGVQGHRVARPEPGQLERQQRLHLGGRRRQGGARERRLAARALGAVVAPSIGRLWRCGARGGAVPVPDRPRPCGRALSRPVTGTLGRGIDDGKPSVVKAAAEALVELVRLGAGQALSSHVAKLSGLVQSALSAHWDTEVQRPLQLVAGFCSAAATETAMAAGAAEAGRAEAPA